MFDPEVGPIVALTIASAIDDPRVQIVEFEQAGAIRVEPKKYQPARTDDTADQQDRRQIRGRTVL